MDEMSRCASFFTQTCGLLPSFLRKLARAFTKTAKTRVIFPQKNRKIAIDNRSLLDKYKFGAQNSLSVINKMQSDASDDFTATDKVLSEPSDTFTATDKAQSEASDTSTATNNILSETSDSLADSHKHESEGQENKSPVKGNKEFL